MLRSFDLYKLAAQQMIDQNFVIFDTETTGIGAEDEIVELGIVDCQGTVLYDGMFRPERAMSIGASRVSGITDSMLVREPRFADEFDKIVEIMDGAGVIAFNEGFDERMFYQTARKYGLDCEILDRIFSKAYCAQQLYDKYIGFDKTKLELACKNEGIHEIQTHRATGDCVMTLALISAVADRDREPDYDKYCKLKAEATGKSEDQVSRPLGGKRKNPIVLEYLKMFQDGVSIEEMAEFKKVKVQTVEENLVYCFKEGHLDSIDFMIQEEFEPAIREYMKRDDWDGRFTPIKKALPEECTWTTIRAVTAKVRKEEENGLDKRLENASVRSERSKKEYNLFTEIDQDGPAFG